MNDDDTVVQVENQGAHSSMNSAPELVKGVYGAISHLNYGMNARLHVFTMLNIESGVCYANL